MLYYKQYSGEKIKACIKLLSHKMQAYGGLLEWTIGICLK